MKQESTAKGTGASDNPDEAADAPDSVRRLDAWIQRINGGLHLFAAFWLFVLAFLILVDVTGRGLFSIPLQGTPEIIANSVVCIAFLQLCNAVRMGRMLRVEILDAFVPESVTKALRVTGFVLGAILFAAIAYSSWTPMIEAWRIGEFAGDEGSLRVPTYPVRTVLVAMCILATVNYVLMAWQTLRGELDMPHTAA